MHEGLDAKAIRQCELADGSLKVICELRLLPGLNLLSWSHVKLQFGRLTIAEAIAFDDVAPQERERQGWQQDKCCGTGGSRYCFNHKVSYSAYATSVYDLDAR